MQPTEESEGMTKVSLKPKATASLSLSTLSHYQLSVSCAAAVKTNPHPPVFLFGHYQLLVFWQAVIKQNPVLCSIDNWQREFPHAAKSVFVPDMSQTTVTPNYKALMTEQRNHVSKSVQLEETRTSIRLTQKHIYLTQINPPKVLFFENALNVDTFKTGGLM